MDLSTLFRRLYEHAGSTAFEEMGLAAVVDASFERARLHREKEHCGGRCVGTSEEPCGAEIARRIGEMLRAPRHSIRANLSDVADGQFVSELPRRAGTKLLRALESDKRRREALSTLFSPPERKRAMEA